VALLHGSRFNAGAAFRKNYVPLLRNIKIIMSWRRWAVKSFSVVSISTVLPSVTVIAFILDVTIAVPVVGTTGTVAVAATVAIIVPITVATLVLARRILPSAATGGRRASTTRRSSTATITIAA
jgi:membrane protein implicated in regulation of membrane protease activity